MYSSPHHVLNHALFVINHLNVYTQGQAAMKRHWTPEGIVTRPLMKWKDLLTGEWRGRDMLLTCGRGYACVFPQDSTSPVWIPDRLTHHVTVPWAPGSRHLNHKRERTRLCHSPEESSRL